MTITILQALRQSATVLFSSTHAVITVQP